MNLKKCADQHILCMNMYSGQIKIIHVCTIVLAIIEIVYGLLVTIIHILFK